MTPPRVLVYTSPACGHLYPAVDIALGLARRGCTIELHALADQLPALAGLGFELHPLSPAIEAMPLDDGQARTSLGGLRRIVRVFARRAPIEARVVTEVIEARRPELLLIDISTLGAAAVAEGSELPWGLFAPYFLPLPSRDAPPFGLGLRPRRDLLGRARDRAISATVGLALEPGRRAMNDVRRALGRPPVADLRTLPLAAPRLLAMTCEPFEYPRSDWPPSVRLCGPARWAPAAASTPAWLTEDGPPFVLVTASTETQDDRSLITAALAALADAPYRVVATTAAHDPASFVAPPNARVERFVPHDAILARAAAVICHGGMGITQRALSAGVPVCVVPHRRDQLEVAQRVQRASAGVYLPRRRLSPSALARAFETTLRCREGADALGAIFRSHGGGDAAAAALLELHRGKDAP